MTLKGRRLFIADTAEQDLQDIHDYIAKQNPEAASRFLAALMAKAEQIAQQGITGFSRDYLSRGLRVFPFRDRCFYLLVEQEKITLIRVLHDRQDIGPDAFMSI